MPTACGSWRRVGKAEVDMEVDAKVVEEKLEEKEVEDEEEEAEEENNCDKIQQPSPGRWGNRDQKKTNRAQKNKQGSTKN